jgi:hypothetical protein
MHYEESNKIKALRTLATIVFIIGIIGSISTAWDVSRTGNDMSVGLFLLIFVGGSFGTFLFTVITMVFLDMAADISITKQSNLDILKHLQKSIPLQENTMTSGAKARLYIRPCKWQ